MGFMVTDETCLPMSTPSFGMAQKGRGRGREGPRETTIKRDDRRDGGKSKSEWEKKRNKYPQSTFYILEMLSITTK